MLSPPSSLERLGWTTGSSLHHPSAGTATGSLATGGLYGCQTWAAERSSAHSRGLGASSWPLNHPFPHVMASVATSLDKGRILKEIYWGEVAGSGFFIVVKNFFF